MATVALSTKAVGSLVKIKESGVLQEFYVAKHGYPTAGNGRTLLVRRYLYDMRQWTTTGINTYANSTIDSWLNSTYLGLIAADIQAQIAAVSIPYTPGNGNNTLSNLSRKVFLLSLWEFGKAPQYSNQEGASLGLTGLLVATTSAGIAQAQWTRSPYTYNSSQVWVLRSDGVNTNDYCTNTNAARPAFTLPSTIQVNSNDEVFMNTPPVINYTGSTALGTKTAGFTLNYSISDSDGDAVTVTEKLTGITKRTHTPALGATQQFQAVLPANFQTILNGAQTLTIEATDGEEAATPVNITFTKAVYSCSVTLSSPLYADDMPTAVRLSISGDIPGDAVWSAEVCNNGNDASPTWENIKPSIQSGYNYVFSNTTKTAANWGVNFRISVARGPGNTGGYIYAIEGGFQ